MVLADLTRAFKAQPLIKATLSKPTGHSYSDLKNIYLKPVQIKGKPMMAATWRFATRDEVKNYPIETWFEKLEAWLDADFREAVFFTETEQLELKANKKGEYQLLRRAMKEAAITSTPPAQENNRTKKRVIDQKAPWLHDLGITTAIGEIKADAQDKWRQMNKYIEVIGALLDSTPLTANALVVDMGAGKGYLTFALAEYLRAKYPFEVQVLGVELRENLVNFCNQVAEARQCKNLSFVAQDIAEVQAQKIDMLIALHACDTATDLALFAGMQSKAKIIVVAPCCHKQVRKAMKGSDAVNSILANGIMLERQAEIITDTIRSLLLQTEGYKTKVFEFISLEHTPKNVMITAEKRSPKAELVEEARAQVAALKATFGVETHYLEVLSAQV